MNCEQVSCGTSWDTCLAPHQLAEQKTGIPQITQKPKQASRSGAGPRALDRAMLRHSQFYIQKLSRL